MASAAALLIQCRKGRRRKKVNYNCITKNGIPVLQPGYEKVTEINKHQHQSPTALQVRYHRKYGTSSTEKEPLISKDIKAKPRQSSVTSISFLQPNYGGSGDDDNNALKWAKKSTAAKNSRSTRESM